MLIKPGLSSKTSESIRQDKNGIQQAKVGPEVNTKNVWDYGTKHPTNTNNVREDVVKCPTNIKNANDDIMKFPKNRKNVNEDVNGYTTYYNLAQ